MTKYVELGTLIKQAKTVKCGKNTYPVLSMTMHNGLVFQDEKFKKVIASKDTSEYKVVFRNQLVISFPIDEGVLATQRITDAGIVSPAYGIWDVDQDKVIPEFLELCLRCPRAISYYKAKLRGSTARRRSLPTPTLLAFTVPLPSVEDQEKILNIINKAKGLICYRENELARLVELIKARFVELFDLSNCQYKTLEECTDFVDYRGHTPELSDAGTIRMVNAKSVGKGFFKYVDEFIIEETYDSWMHRGFGYPGDILFVTEGHTFGNTCLIPDDMTKFALGQRVITIKGHDEIKNAFLCSYMQTDMFWKDINVYRTGGTAQGIRSKDLVKVSVPIPDIDVQLEFMNLVKQVDKSKVAVQKSLEETQLLFDSLMQKYFGE